MLGKKLWVRHRFFEELLALLQVYLSLTLIIRSILPLFQRSLIHFYSIRIIMIYLAEHSISHRFQHRVICLQSFSFHPLHVRRKRVSRNLFPKSHLPHLSRQQLPVIFGNRGLGDDFLHHRDFALRLVLLSIDFSLLPQVVVCLSRYLHRSKEGYQK